MSFSVQESGRDGEGFSSVVREVSLENALNMVEYYFSNFLGVVFEDFAVIVCALTNPTVNKVIRTRICFIFLFMSAYFHFLGIRECVCCTTGSTCSIMWLFLHW